MTYRIRTVICWLLLLAAFLALVLGHGKAAVFSDGTAHAQALIDEEDSEENNSKEEDTEQNSKEAGTKEEDTEKETPEAEDTKEGDVPPGRILGASAGTAKVVGDDTGGAMLKSAQQVGSTCVITRQEEHFYGSWSTFRLKVETGGHSYTGYCAQPSRDTPSGTYPVSELKNDRVKFMLMCSPGGPLYKKYGPSLFRDAGGKDFAYAHAAIGYIYCKDTTGLDTEQVDLVKDIIAEIKELMKEPDNAKLMEKYTAYVAYNNDQDIVWLVETGPDVGYIRLAKKDAQDQLTKGNALYSLSGAVFGVYKDAACSDKAGTLSTGEDGSTEKLELEVGTYYLREDKAPPGYRLNASVMKGVIKEEETTTVTVQEEPQYATVDLAVKKVDKESGEAVPLGGASLAGGQFLIEYYAAAQAGSLSTRRWILQSDEDGCCPMDAEHKLEGDEFYKDRNGKVVLPLGTVVISEVRAPEGYLVSSDKITKKLTDSSGGRETIIYEPAVIEDQVIRGDLEFNKISERDQSRLGGIPFQITSQTTGENHTVITDDNGYISTSSEWNLHSHRTNAGETAGDGVWFGEDVEVNDKLGALPYDTYTVEEQPCEANEGYELVSFDINITRNNVVVKGGTVSDKRGEEPGIGTKAYEAETGEDWISPGQTVTILDEVDYRGLEEGESYTLTGVLMDAQTGEVIIENEHIVSAEQSFTAEKPEGTEKMSFTLDATDLEGRDTVVFEKLYNSEGEEIASHEDLKSEKQTVHFRKKEEKKKTVKKAKKTISTPGQRRRTGRVKTGDLLDPVDLVLLVLIMGFFAASELSARLPKRA